MKFSDQGLHDLQDWENKDGKPARTAYLDNAGVWTIGTGHTLGVKRGDTCSLAQAATWLMEDCQKCEMAANYYVKVDLTQSEYDALVIWMFNVGVDAFIRSTALKELNLGHYEACSEQMQRFKYITVTDSAGKKTKVAENGLVNRRAKEAALWSQDFVSNENGSATPTEPPTTVTQTTTGKITIAGLATNIGGAVALGTATVQPITNSVRGVTETISGFSGATAIIIGTLLGASILLSIAMLVHKRAAIGNASQGET